MVVATCKPAVHQAAVDGNQQILPSRDVNGSKTQRGPETKGSSEFLLLAQPLHIITIRNCMSGYLLLRHHVFSFKVRIVVLSHWGDFHDRKVYSAVHKINRGCVRCEEVK
jgi:hypothetical protein